MLFVPVVQVTDIAPDVTNRTMLASCPPPVGQALMLFADTMLLLVDPQARGGKWLGPGAKAGGPFPEDILEARGGDISREPPTPSQIMPYSV